MRVFAVLIAATAIYLGAHDVALAQATVPSATPPLTGLGSTPVTSTGHELHDVVQLPGSNMPNRLRHPRGADLKRNKEHVVRDRLHFDPGLMSDGLLPTVLPNWTIKRAVVRLFRG